MRLPFGLPRWLRLSLLMPGAYLLARLAAAHPGPVEAVYSRRLYLVIARGLAAVFGRLPFSAAEILLTAGVLGLLFYLGRTATAWRRGRLSPRAALARLTPLPAAAGVLAAGFLLLWGLNYHRLPFATLAGYPVEPAPVEDLAALVEELIHVTQAERAGLPEDSAGAMTLPGGVSSVLTRADAGYAAVAQTFPILVGEFGSPKATFFSRALSWAGIYGIYSPFTGEAQVNREIPASQLASTVCHEMAHQRGFAREDEANYIAWLACRRHPDQDFRYSGALLALLHAADALRNQDPERYRELRARYGPEIQRDLDAIRSWQDQFAGPVERISTRVNDSYLKANHQADGTASYGRMVDLLLAERRAASGGS